MLANIQLPTRKAAGALLTCIRPRMLVKALVAFAGFGSSAVPAANETPASWMFVTCPELGCAAPQVTTGLTQSQCQGLLDSVEQRGVLPAATSGWVLCIPLNVRDIAKPTAEHKR